MTRDIKSRSESEPISRSDDRENADEDTFVCDCLDINGNVCGKEFKSQKSLEGHMLRVHRISPSGPRVVGTGGGGVSSRGRRESPMSDLWSELPDIKNAVTFSRWKRRLERQDPKLFSLFFPGENIEGKGSQEPTQQLVNLEVAKTMRAMRKAESGEFNSNPKVDTLRDENIRLRQQLHEKDRLQILDLIDRQNQTIETLRATVDKIDRSPGDTNNEAIAMIREGGKALARTQQNIATLAETISVALTGIPLDVNKARPAAKGSRERITQRLRKFNLTVPE